MFELQLATHYHDADRWVAHFAPSPSCDHFTRWPSPADFGQVGISRLFGICRFGIIMPSDLASCHSLLRTCQWPWHRFDKIARALPNKSVADIKRAFAALEVGARACALHSCLLACLQERVNVCLQGDTPEDCWCFGEKHGKHVVCT